MCHEGQTLDFQSTALPTELPSLLPMRIVIFPEGQKTTFSGSSDIIWGHEAPNS